MGGDSFSLSTCDWQLALAAEMSWCVYRCSVFLENFQKERFRCCYLFSQRIYVDLDCMGFHFQKPKAVATLFKQKITSGIDACACFVGYELIIQNDEEKQQTREIIS